MRQHLHMHGVEATDKCSGEQDEAISTLFQTKAFTSCLKLMEKMIFVRDFPSCCQNERLFILLINRGRGLET